MGNKKIKLALFCLLWPCLGQAELKPQDWEKKPVCFGSAKSFLRKVYRENHWNRDFYCGCPLEPSGKLLETKGCYVEESDLNLTRQGVAAPQLYADRHLVVEWEHVVPASVLGDRHLTLNKAKKDCRAEQPKLPNPREVDSRKLDQAIAACGKEKYERNKTILSDPHNLYPVMGQLNALRGDKVMTAVEPAAELFSLCQFSLDAAFVEPPQRIKGDIARIYYYMANKYPAKRAEILNFHVRAALLDWCKADPLNDEERQRVQAVVQATGVQNPFLEQSCETLAANLLDPAPGTVHFPLPKTAQRPEPPSPKRIALKGSPAQEKTPALPRSERQNPPSGTKPPLPLPSTASAQL
ncbi:MAG: hypothetical protein A2600_09335 [Candidatus Lambdaproteobacteria bacterium RIFOXYD1_FULL_56_27]|uniref:Endonuclease I n=1 Tax=Candidatus Lambdaproteobacteria bacterium RIFOXYD2_FULL_56_26 TaxID=1817773 RepID=A0A1F6GUJ7_9PROT|nr:MAG: hypothetical protein A2557_04605 [Candidatus Lambdaproteobacteria bacterium RIFOXYD2_FULL_56_26]OGH02256.1 MAG: hypothetical protein A2426_03085 [Candidatus Lambdaproteobacteria bacterium RIFOXYC1_FULL_56_13]OGH10025.1 MAG: hypothetical protein A2600_09335 [Candidatus Lambdaproteobacteria bacterium RIFOXYD1_FULL_56_27]